MAVILDLIKKNFREFLEQKTSNGRMRSFARGCSADLATVQGWIEKSNPTLKSLVAIANATGLSMAELGAVLDQNQEMMMPQVGVIGRLIRQALIEEGIDPESLMAIERFAIASGLESQEDRILITAIIQGEMVVVGEDLLGFVAFGLNVLTGENYTIESLKALQNKNPASHERDNGECLNGGQIS